MSDYNVFDNLQSSSVTRIPRQQGTCYCKKTTTCCLCQQYTRIECALASSPYSLFGAFVIVLESRT